MTPDELKASAIAAATDQTKSLLELAFEAVHQAAYKAGHDAALAGEAIDVGEWTRKGNKIIHPTGEEIGKGRNESDADYIVYEHNRALQAAKK
jgi:hypothetical protein